MEFNDIITQKNSENFIRINNIDYSYYGKVHFEDDDSYWNEIGACFMLKSDKDKYFTFKSFTDELLDSLTCMKHFYMKDREEFNKIPFEIHSIKIDKHFSIPMKVGTVLWKIENTSI